MLHAGGLRLGFYSYITHTYKGISFQSSFAALTGKNVLHPGGKNTVFRGLSQCKGFFSAAVNTEGKANLRDGVQITLHLGLKTQGILGRVQAHMGDLHGKIAGACSAANAPAGSIPKTITIAKNSDKILVLLIMYTSLYEMC